MKWIVKWVIRTNRRCSQTFCQGIWYCWSFPFSQYYFLTFKWAELIVYINYSFCIKEFHCSEFKLYDSLTLRFRTSSSFFKVSANHLLNLSIIISFTHLLNPQSRCLKIDAYLLNLVSHDFWRQIATLFSFDKS